MGKLVPRLVYQNRRNMTIDRLEENGDNLCRCVGLRLRNVTIIDKRTVMNCLYIGVGKSESLMVQNRSEYRNLNRIESLNLESSLVGRINIVVRRLRTGYIF